MNNSDNHNNNNNNNNINTNNSAGPDAMEKVSVSFLNVKNLRSNFIYPENLVNIYDISYFNELWCSEPDINLIRSLCSKQNDKRVLFKSDMNETYKNGRPFGGQAWFIPKKFDLLDNKFLSRFVSYIHLKIDQQELLLIGVYMPFENKKKKKRITQPL